jgi:hypothetical protein
MSKKEEGKGSEKGDKPKSHSRRGSISETFAPFIQRVRSLSTGSSEKKAKKKAAAKAADDQGSSSSSSSSSPARRLAAHAQSEPEEDDPLMRQVDGRHALDVPHSSASMPEISSLPVTTDSPRSRKSSSNKKLKRKDLEEMLRTQSAAIQDDFAAAINPIRSDIQRLKDDQQRTATSVQTLLALRVASSIPGRPPANPQPSATMLDASLEERATFRRRPEPKSKSFCCGCNSGC